MSDDSFIKECQILCNHTLYEFPPHRVVTQGTALGHPGGEHDRLLITAAFPGKSESQRILFGFPFAARLAFLAPGMTMRIKLRLPASNETVGLFEFVDSMENFKLVAVTVFETQDEDETGGSPSLSMLSFDLSGRILSERPFHPRWGNRYQRTSTTFGGTPPGSPNSQPIRCSPFTPLTSVMSGSMPYSFLCIFLSNLGPGTKSYTDRRSGQYVSNNLLVVDQSFDSASPWDARMGTKQLPQFSLQHFLPGSNILSLPMLTVGDILEVRRVSPVRKQNYDQTDKRNYSIQATWNLYHKSRTMGDTEVYELPVGFEDGREGRSPILIGANDYSKFPRPQHPEFDSEEFQEARITAVRKLREWSRKYLSQGSLIEPGINEERGLGHLKHDDYGIDVVAELLSISENGALLVDDYTSLDSQRQVRLERASSTEWLSKKVKEGDWLLLRNVRLCRPSTVFGIPYFISRVPEWCRDVQEAKRRKEAMNEQPAAESTVTVEPARNDRDIEAIDEEFLAPVTYRKEPGTLFDLQTSEPARNSTVDEDMLAAPRAMTNPGISLIPREGQENFKPVKGANGYFQVAESQKDDDDGAFYEPSQTTRVVVGTEPKRRKMDWETLVADAGEVPYEIIDLDD